jgi:hypothetical protein
MILTPLPEFHVWTPLGKAICVGVFAACEDPEWMTWINATGEPFWWTGRHIRRAPNVTNALPEVSGFSSLNSRVLEHIERYRRNGFLPPTFNPHDPRTWV